MVVPSLAVVAPPKASAPEPRARIKKMEVVVVERIVETPDTTTLVLFTGNDRLNYSAGHFLTIDPHQFASLDRFTAFLEDLKGKKEPARAYSLTSAPHERHLAITVKEERYTTGTTRFPPLLSPMLVRRTIPGMRLVVTGFTGPYTLAEEIEQQTDHLVHVCAGSGSVPNFSILKHALANHPRLRHTFVYSNKTLQDTIFRGQLEALAAEHPERLKLVFALTREQAPITAAVRRGRVDAAMLKEAIGDPSSCVVYACGPAVTTWDKQVAKQAGTAPAPRFLETALAALEEIGVSDDRIHYESYG